MSVRTAGGGSTLPLTKSSAKITPAPRVSKNVHFLRADARELPFPDESFDLVTSNYVYHNIPGDRQALLRESLRVLKKAAAS